MSKKMSKSSVGKSVGENYSGFSFVQIEIQKVVNGLDVVASSMEHKWGSGVLPMVVSEPMAKKFGLASDKLNEAIEAGDYDGVKMYADNLIKGWHAMDREATNLGYDKEPIYWRGVCGDIEMLITQTDLDAKLLAGRIPSKASSILSVNDVARLAVATSVINNRTEIPAVFAVEKKNTLGDIIDDEIPF